MEAYGNKSLALNKLFNQLRATRVNQDSTFSVPRLKQLFENLSRALSPAFTPVMADAVSHSQLQTFLLDFAPLFKEAREKGDFIDIWTVAGLKRNEMRNAAVLSWLLDAEQSHGRGPHILKALLKEISTTTPGNPGFPLDLGSYVVSTECYPLGNSESRVDIVIDGEAWTLFVEIKIDAIESLRQIERYVELARAKSKLFGHNQFCVILLTPERRVDLGENVISATWEDVAKSISNTVNDSGSFGDRLLAQFARHIRQF